MTTEVMRFQREISVLNLTPAPQIKASATIWDAIELMKKSKTEAVVVVENGTIVGLIEERDLFYKVLWEKKHLNFLEIIHFMKIRPTYLNLNCSIRKGIQLMCAGHMRNLPICNEENKLVGLLSIRDILSFLTEEFQHEMDRVGQIIYGEEVEFHINDESDYGKEEKDEISKSVFLRPLARITKKLPVFMDYQSLVTDVIAAMVNQRTSCAVLVKYSCKLVGIVTEKDLVMRVLATQQPIEGLRINQYMTPNPFALQQRQYVAHALMLMDKKRFRQIPIVDEDQYPLEVISLEDILFYISEQLFGE